MEMSSEVQSFLDIFYRCKRRVSAFLIDETIIQIGSSNEALLMGYCGTNP